MLDIRTRLPGIIRCRMEHSREPRMRNIVFIVDKTGREPDVEVISRALA